MLREFVTHYFSILLLLAPHITHASNFMIVGVYEGCSQSSAIVGFLC